MKKDWSIRWGLLIRFLLAALCPVAIFIIITREDIWILTLPFEAAVVLAVIIGVVLAMFFTNPYMRAVKRYRAAQRRLENGDFTVSVNMGKNAPRELREIAQGFNRIVTRMKQMVERTKSVAEEQRIAELSALEAQIDPHFLYNTLDAINWKAIENEQYEISELLGALADIFRHTVQNTGGITTLGKALLWLDQYVLLQSVKLGKEPELIIKVPEELREFRMHKLLLQPFVENAVKYAFLENEGACILTVEAKRLGGQLHVIIEDNGIGMDEELVKQLNGDAEALNGHLGVANVRKRLKLYYGEEATVYFESARGCYTRVHLFIPMLNGE